MTRVYVTWFLKGLDLRSDTVVIVDVLRFSTTVSIALQIGFKSIYVFPKLSDAVNYAKTKKIPLLAEVNGIKPSEAEMDNSPSDIMQKGWEYLSKGIDELVIRTSAGGVLTSEAAQKKFDKILIASITNAKSVAEFLFNSRSRIINIICAGIGLEKFAIEDLIGAGALVHEMLRIGMDIELNSEAIAALKMFQLAENRLQDFMKLSESGKIVESVGHYSDIEIASMLNISRAIPYAEPLKDFKGAIIRNAVLKHNTNLDT
jgi:2-phosphosulfolactate phosphatase